MRKRSSSSRPPASRRSSWTTRSSSTRWCSSSCGDARRARGTSRAATRDRSRSAIPHSSAWGRTPPRSAACAGTSRRGTASPSAPPSRPRPARSSAFSRTACAEGIPVPFRAGFWTLGIADKRIWVWIVLVLALVVYLLQLYLERSRRGFQLAAVREDEDAALSLGVRAPAQGRGDRRERSVHGGLRRALGAVRRFRRSALRLLGRPVGALRARRDHRRPGHRARTLPRLGARHHRGDVAARRVRRPRLASRRPLSHSLRHRPDTHGALCAAGPHGFFQEVMTLLRVSKVTKRFGGITANREISFEVAAGELVGIIGPNGAGKSTLFECISGFYAPDEGEVELEGKRLTGLSPDLVCRRGVA